MSSPKAQGFAQGPSQVTEDSSLPSNLSFKCAVTDSKGPRRYMEDAHSIVVPYGGVRGQGFFAIFDGHAGKHAAEWCGQNFSVSLINALRKDKSAPVPDVLNETFHDVDMSLSRLSEESDGKMHSGCTAVTAFLRLEDENGEQSFLPPDFELVAPRIPSGEHSDEATKQSKGTTDSSSQSSSDKVVVTPANVRRVLYCANAGDARGVLCRAGKAVRLTYDHKGSDKQEAKRITDAGGFVMSGRVNGVLAVTRSLGDSSMKDFVVGAPYTTETELNDYDEFLILACDGLWDVVSDQDAVDLVRGISDPKKAAEELLEHAYKKYSTDNVTVLVVRFRNPPEMLRSD